jgi:hypothetical protein
MAGIKRRLDETDPARAKETKVQIPTEHQRPIKTVISSRVKPPALSADDSSVVSQGFVGTSITGGSSSHEQQGEDPVPRRKVFRSGFRAGKTSESAKGGEVFQNGDYVCKAVARPCN